MEGFNCDIEHPFWVVIIYIVMNCSSAMSEIYVLYVLRITGPQVGTPVCSYYVVYMLPALHRPARGSLVGC